MQAGGRALLAPTPLHLALSSYNGRMTARVAIMLGLPKSAQNFIAKRTEVVRHLMSAHIHKPNPLTVDPFAAFSPLGYLLAEQFPQGTHLDIGKATVMQALESRLSNPLYKVPPLPNHRLVTLDYRTGGLQSVLPQPADSILCNNAYYTRAESVQLLRYLQQFLAADGAIVTTFPHKLNIEKLRDSLRFFRSNVGDFPIEVSHPKQVIDIMQEAGYSDISVMYASDLAATLNLPTPILDIEMFAVGRCV